MHGEVLPVVGSHSFGPGNIPGSWRLYENDWSRSSLGSLRVKRSRTRRGRRAMALFFKSVSTNLPSIGMPSKTPDFIIARHKKAGESQESTGGSFSKDPDVIRIYGNIIKDMRPKPSSRMRIYAKSSSPNPPQGPRPSTSMSHNVPKQPVVGKPINEYRNLRIF